MESSAFARSNLVIEILKFLDCETLQDDITSENKSLVRIALECLADKYFATYEDKLKMSRINLLSWFTTKVQGLTDEELYEAENFKDFGNWLMKAGKYEEAVAEFSKAIQINPANHLYYCNRAIAYLKINIIDRTLEDCKQALVLHPGCSQAYEISGSAYLNLENWIEAWRAFENCMRYDPGNKSIGEKFEFARSKFYETMDLAIPSQFKPTDFSNFVNCNRYVKQMKLLTNIDFDVSNNEHSAPKTDNVNEIETEKEGEKTKVEVKDQAVQADQEVEEKPTPVEANKKQEKEQPQKKEAEPGKVCGYQLTLQEFEEDPEDVLAEKLKLLNLNERNSFYFSMRAASYINFNSNEEALLLSQEALRWNPNSAAAYHTLGVSLMNLEQYIEGFKAFRQAVALDPKTQLYKTHFRDAKIQVFLAIENAMLPPEIFKEIADDLNYESMKTELEAVSEQKVAECYRSLGDYEKEHGCFEGAVTNYSKAIEADPQCADYYCLRAKAYNDLSKSHEAIADCKKALEMNACNGETFDTLGVAYLNMRDWMESCRSFIRALHYEPNNITYLHHFRLVRDQFAEVFQDITLPDVTTRFNSSVTGFNWVEFVEASMRLDAEIDYLWTNTVTAQYQEFEFSGFFTATEPYDKTEQMSWDTAPGSSNHTTSQVSETSSVTTEDVMN